MANNNEALELLRRADPSLRITGIGSVPFIDSDEACEIILEYCPIIPYVPQLIRRDLRENMFLQFSENLPCIVVDLEGKRVIFDETSGRERELEDFYTNVEHGEYEAFCISPEYAQGLPVMLEKCAKRSNPFIKTQVTGPVTYLLSLLKRDRKPAIYDDEFSEAITAGLAMKALWQVQEIRKTGKKALLFFDEPSLAILGSAYAPVPIYRAQFLIENLLGFMKDRDPDLIVGIHCCGNTDWGMLFESGVDIVSLDSFSCGDKLMLYPAEIKRFMERGGLIAYGIVPTSEYGKWTVEQALHDQFMSIVSGLEAKGVPRSDLIDHAMFTPACGMGPLRPQDAIRILGFVVSLARRIEKRGDKR